MSTRYRHWKFLPAMVVLLALTACYGDNKPVKGFVKNRPCLVLQGPGLVLLLIQMLWNRL